MGGAMVEAFPAAAQVMQAAERVFPGLWKVCREGPEELLRQTVYTQPAVLAVSVALWEVFRREAGRTPAAAAGHSLGEYTALVAAGAMPFEAALAVVRARAEAMEAALPGGRGSMGAVIGLEDEAVEAICEEVSRRRRPLSGEPAPASVVAANFNAPGQVVVSGLVEALDEVREAAMRAGGRYVPLPVSGPFHSPFMAPAAKTFAPVLERAPMQAPAFPVVANVTARPMPGNARAMQELLVAQVTSPVRWAGALRAMAAMGVSHFVEIGPGKALTGMVRRTLPDAVALSVQDPPSLDAALARLKGDGLI
ncbi:MAG: ACP S-malonyltransferase [Limnochordaceae bacterium]|nr:ACP S-malonyltransferase [Limnochordaceae bacterium]